MAKRKARKKTKRTTKRKRTTKKRGIGRWPKSAARAAARGRSAPKRRSRGPKHGGYKRASVAAAYRAAKKQYHTLGERLRRMRG